MVKICIFGAGAIGGHIAGHLARAQHCEVSLVGRGEALRAIKERGLIVETPEGRFTTHPHATDDPAALGPQDYVLLTLKAQQLPASLPQLPSLIGPATVLLPPTTGLPAAFLHGLTGTFGDRPLTAVDPDGAQIATMPPAQTLGIVYWIGAHGIAPGHVAQDGPKASCMVGEFNGSQSERVTRLGQILTASGIETPVRKDIRSDIWVKFVNSLVWNPVAVLTEATIGGISGDAEAIGTVRAMMEEADAVARTLGIDIRVAPEKRIAVTSSAPGHKMSMLQDFQAGRPMEVDALARSIEAVRTLAGVETPKIEALLSLIALRSRTSPYQGA